MLRRENSPRMFTQEIEGLASEFGPTRLVNVTLEEDLGALVGSPGRIAEVCMVVRRPSGTFLVIRKPAYPPDVFRLPTGGLHRGEGILEALKREVAEETGLTIAIRRFLAAIRYTAGSVTKDNSAFHTFAFLVDEIDGKLGSCDEEEELEFKEVDLRGIRQTAEDLERVTLLSKAQSQIQWPAWGRFRAIAHHAVSETLSQPGSL